MLKYSSTFTTLLCSNSSTSFTSSRTLLFALSRFEFTTDSYFCQLDLSLVASCFCFLKWGEPFGLPRCSAQPAHVFICWPHTELLFLTHNLTSKTRFHSFIIFSHILYSPVKLHFRGAHDALFVFNNILPLPSFYRRCFIFETHAHACLNHAAYFCLQE